VGSKTFLSFFGAILIFENLELTFEYFELFETLESVVLFDLKETLEKFDFIDLSVRLGLFVKSDLLLRLEM